MAQPAAAGRFPIDDADLVSRAQKGDRGAFQQLVERHYRQVINVGYRAFGNLPAAEDVAQEVFLKVFQNLDTYRSEKPFIHWLHRVASNTVIDAIRRRRPQDSLDDRVDELTSSEAERPDVTFERRELQSKIRAAIAQLPAPYREAISLRAYHELSYEEIASVLGIPLGTVMSRLHNAKRILRETLQSNLGEGAVNKP